MFSCGTKWLKTRVRLPHFVARDVLSDVYTYSHRYFSFAFQIVCSARSWER